LLYLFEDFVLAPVCLQRAEDAEHLFDLRMAGLPE
jgi:hypothetical protein